MTSSRVCLVLFVAGLAHVSCFSFRSFRGATTCSLHRYTCFPGNACPSSYIPVSDPKLSCFAGQLCCEVAPCVATCQNGDCVGNDCVCEDGFSGSNCEIDACANNGNCANGTCVRISGDPLYSCECDLGYSGYNCDVEIPTCADTCQNGICIGEDCECQDGFSGSNCEIDACANNGNCVNGACVRISGDPLYSCDCDLGYSEYNCDVLNWTCTMRETTGVKADETNDDGKQTDNSLDECKTSCIDDVQCVYADYKDNGDCRVFYSLPKEKNDNKYILLEKRCSMVCDPACVNGLCQEDGSGNRFCECDLGFYGDTCETDACDPDPCAEGTCVGNAIDPFYTCSCNPGFGGEHCSVQVCNFTETASTKGDGPGREARVKDQTVEDCKTLCLQEETCVAAEHKDNNDCHLWLDNLPATKTDNKYVWLEKTCNTLT